MMPTFILGKVPRWLVLMLPLMLGLQASPAWAQVKPKSAPVATTTLDICHNTVTGNWRYSGMVAVSGAALQDSSIVSIEYVVQNKVFGAGYVDSYSPARVTDAALLPSTGSSRLARFSSEAPPLSLGTVRNTARVRIADPLNPGATPFILAPSQAFAATVCGCTHPRGCTRTQGYWGNKPGVAWPAPYSRQASFFSNGLSWQQILDTPPRGGNAYLILAHQYIAALLNKAAGASAPGGIQTVINDASAFFASGTTSDSCGGAACETQKTWAGILDTYNNGLYPGAPLHCGD